ncbi:DUF998 domain-containing protein [Luteithermobacter gelatinilyticus]|uniref:DUF998 domain-containing protein n=1 Tax=Luteithermobacter gelatinilyticus TaxID=2582913 RepID=UPI001105A5F9|nr:DUF998 domain-containing protein [Luteithermobacter gelatinilyticus]
MSHESTKSRSLVISYLTLRKAIGVLGLSLPFVLVLGALILFATPLQGSISDYYYTGMRDVFVGIMCAIGVFLFSYRGYERKDDLAGDLAGLFAIGIALFPTKPSPADLVTAQQQVISQIHTLFTALFFLTLAYFCLRLFIKTTPDMPPTPEKLMRNRIYRICGYTILASILLIALYLFVLNGEKKPFTALKPVFWFETLAVLAFGLSWLVKGEAILKDQKYDAPAGNRGDN